MLHISRNKDIQDRLRQELRALSTSILITAADHQLPSAKELDSLPLLHAIVKESLRLRPTHPEGQPRITPQSTTTTLGKFPNIPGYVRVNSYPWCLHRNPDIYPEPERWIPDRWIEEGDAFSYWKKADYKIEQWFWAFGRGPRMCLGSNLVMHSKSPPSGVRSEFRVHNHDRKVMKFILALVYTNFRSCVVDDSAFGKHGRFVSGEHDENLILRFEFV
jgi:cytochrome P450